MSHFALLSKRSLEVFYCLNKRLFLRTLWWSRGEELARSLLCAQVQSLIEELIPHKLCMAKKKKKKDALGYSVVFRSVIQTHSDGHHALPVLCLD